MDPNLARREVAYFMRRLYRQRLTTTSGGNISVRVEGDLIAMTPASLDKARLRPDQIGLMRLDGENMTPEHKPSVEAGMHLAIYARCPRADAIVHAHPVTATAFTASRTPINARMLAEPYALVGEPVVAPYELTTSDELAQVVAEAVTHADCVLMQNHGVVTVGATLLQAFDRLELIETAAQSTLIGKQLGDIVSLDDDQCRVLDRLVGREPKG